MTTILCILGVLLFLSIFVIAPCIVAGRISAVERAQGVDDGR